MVGARGFEPPTPCSQSSEPPRRQGLEDQGFCGIRQVGYSRDSAKRGKKGLIFYTKYTPRILALFLALALAGGAHAAAAERVGPYDVEVVDVYDGDTFTARVRIWLGQVVEVKVRIDGLDTPERAQRAKCEAERAAAERARAMLAGLLAAGPVVIDDVRYGKFAGRVLARVTAGGRDVAQALIAAGLARPYAGGHREGWCG